MPPHVCKSLRSLRRFWPKKRSTLRYFGRPTQKHQASTEFSRRVGMIGMIVDVVRTRKLHPPEEILPPQSGRRAVDLSKYLVKVEGLAARNEIPPAPECECSNGVMSPELGLG